MWLLEAGLGFVYLGNIATSDGENTDVPEMRCAGGTAPGILRGEGGNDRDGKCGKCGEPLNMIM